PPRRTLHVVQPRVAEVLRSNPHGPPPADADAKDRADHHKDRPKRLEVRPGEDRQPPVPLRGVVSIGDRRAGVRELVYRDCNDQRKERHPDLYRVHIIESLSSPIDFRMGPSTRSARASSASRPATSPSSRAFSVRRSASPSSGPGGIPRARRSSPVISNRS